jgi:hypothetical protein
VEFFFSTNNADPILIANSEDYICLNTLLPWIIAGSAVGVILLFGLLALLILKLCLMALVCCIHMTIAADIAETLIVARYYNFLYHALQCTKR